MANRLRQNATVRACGRSTHEPHDGLRWKQTSAAPCCQQTARHTASSNRASCVYIQIAPGRDYLPWYDVLPSPNCDSPCIQAWPPLYPQPINSKQAFFMIGRFMILLRSFGGHFVLGKVALCLLKQTLAFGRSAREPHDGPP